MTTSKISNTLCWADIPVTNLDRAIEFYSLILGTTITRNSCDGHDFGLLPHEDDNASACLFINPKNQPSEHGPLIYLTVEGRLDEALHLAAAHGGQLLEAKRPIEPYGYKGVIQDSEGNRIGLFSKVE